MCHDHIFGPPYKMHQEKSEAIYCYQATQGPISFQIT